MAHSKQIRRRGFTLVEVIVATSIFALVMAGAFAGLQQGFILTQSAQLMTRAGPIAQSEFEFLRSLDWATLDGLPKTTTVVTLNPTSSIDSNYYTPYTIEREIFPVSASLLRVEVRVTYESAGRSGSNITLRSTSFFTEGGANAYYYRQI